MSWPEAIATSAEWAGGAAMVWALVWLIVRLADMGPKSPRGVKR